MEIISLELVMPAIAAITISIRMDKTKIASSLTFQTILIFPEFIFSILIDPSQYLHRFHFIHSRIGCIRFLFNKTASPLFIKTVLKKYV